jgi:hypothetical protein
MERTLSMKRSFAADDPLVEAQIDRAFARVVHTELLSSEMTAIVRDFLDRSRATISRSFRGQLRHRASPPQGDAHAPEGEAARAELISLAGGEVG